MDKLKRQSTKVAFCVEAKPFVSVGWKTCTLQFCYLLNPIKQPTFTNLHTINTGWQVTVGTVQTGTQINLHSTACRKLKVPNCSVRRHAHVCTPTTSTVSPPLQKQSSSSSYPLLEDADKAQGVKISLALPTEEGPGFTIQVYIHVWSTAMLPRPNK